MLHRYLDAPKKEDPFSATLLRVVERESFLRVSPRRIPRPRRHVDNVPENLLHIGAWAADALAKVDYAAYSFFDV